MQVCAVVADESNEVIFARVYEQVSGRRLAAGVRCEVKRRWTATMGRIALRNGVLEVGLNELMAAAPPTVREALAWVLCSKLTRRRVPPHQALCYRQFLSRKEVRQTQEKLRRVRGRKHVSGPIGEHYDLDVVFDRMQALYFPLLILQKPQLGWSRTRARWQLGHFDAAHNAIILSRLLDQAHVPPLAVDYVMYHEMLHLIHEVEHRGTRRRVHTKAFHAAEREFAGLAEAKEALKRL